MINERMLLIEGALSHTRSISWEVATAHNVCVQTVNARINSRKTDKVEGW